MKKNHLFLFLAILISVASASFIVLVFHLKARLDYSLQKGWFQAPLELYTAVETIKKDMTLSRSELKNKLKKRHILFQEEVPANIEDLSTKQKQPATDDMQITNNETPIKTKKFQASLDKIYWQDGETKKQFSVYFQGQKVYALTHHQTLVNKISLKPFLFAQYEKGAFVLKKFTPLSEVPFHCRMAVLAAEDHSFIRHGGISFKGLLRATYKNLRAWRLKEGASTITQQLVKNIFFDSKKSFWRKFQEQIMAFLLEIRQDRQNKDQILTAYLNTIYMGQSGMFRVHGLRSASEYYMGKPLSRLNLSECALLAGLIKSPGRYKPSPTNQKIKKRRDHILNTLFKKQKEWMLSISPKELDQAKAFPISKPQSVLPPPPYFTDLVYRKIKEMNWPVEKGLKVWTTLYPDFQAKAEMSLKNSLNWLETHRLKKNLNPSSDLQSALINVEVETGAVRAVIGGRDFKKSQFNRVTQSQRQVGSLMKPVVLLSALMSHKELNPLSLVEDSPWTYKYDSQSWSPKNYKNQYKGKVPLYKLLTHSLNAGTARLGVQGEGVKSLIQLIEQLGDLKGLKPHPSLILGALELNLWSVSQIFLSLANMGSYKRQYIVEKVTDLNNNVLYERPSFVETTKRLDPQKVAVIVGMLREVARSGTARSLKNFPVAVAGKTGTTNEERDAWFAGFSPEFLTVVWIGFDDNRSHGLTGAEGALPIWKNFMQKITSSSFKTQFDWPQGVEEKEVKKTLMREGEDPSSLKEKNVKEIQKVKLIFEK